MCSCRQPMGSNVTTDEEDLLERDVAADSLEPNDDRDLDAAAAHARAAFSNPGNPQAGSLRRVAAPRGHCSSLRGLFTLSLFFGSLYALTLLVFYFAAAKSSPSAEDFPLTRLAVLLLVAPVILKYVVHLLVAPWYPAVEWLRSRRRSLPYCPSVSVLIPAWNEEVGIEATIASVLATEYPRL